jgi:hypothetical protein
MNDEDRKYLRETEKMRPGIEIFNNMVRILKNEQEEVARLLSIIDNNLLETYSTVRV